MRQCDQLGQELGHHCALSRELAISIHVEASRLDQHVQHQIGRPHVPSHSTLFSIVQTEIGKSPQIQGHVPCPKEHFIGEGNQRRTLTAKSHVKPPQVAHHRHVQGSV